MTIDALVLSHDPNRVCAENMILQYDRLLGPGFFRFLVPYQENAALSGRIRSEVSLVRCGSTIRESVAALLAEVDPRQMVYWCIDDKYPVALDRTAFEEMRALVRSDPRIDGVSLALARRLAAGAGLGRRTHRLPPVGSVRFHRRRNFNQFWLHQVMRAGCIAHVFSAFPERVAMAKELDAHLDRIVDNPFRMYVAARNCITFGESTTRGALTQNFLSAAAANGLAPDPARRRVPDSILIGEMGAEVRRRRRWRLF
jgi:hypothetical protein